MQNPHAARETLINRVERPAILEKLARDWNIVPQGPADEQAIFEMADALENAYAANQVKTAAHGTPFLADALTGLRQALSQEGLDAGPAPQDHQVKAASFQLAQDPDVAFAAYDYLQHLHAAAE